MNAIHKPSTGKVPNAKTFLSESKFDLVVVVPSETVIRAEDSAAPRTPSKKGANFESTGLSDGYAMRRLAVDFGVSLITNVKCLDLLSCALLKVKSIPTYSIAEYYSGAFERSKEGGKVVGRRRSPSSVTESEMMQVSLFYLPLHSCESC